MRNFALKHDHDLQTPCVITPVAVCEACGGVTNMKVGAGVSGSTNGTRYCCQTAELQALRVFRAEVERRVSFELESPPLDSTLLALLSWAYGRAKSLRHQDF